MKVSVKKAVKKSQKPAMKFLVIPLLVFSFHHGVAAAASLQPGIWQTNSSLDLNGIPLPSSKDENCVSAADAKDVKTSIAKALKKNGCELTKWSLKGQALEASLKCKNNDIEAEGSLHGTVTPKNYELSGDAKGSFKSIPSTASLKLTGQWLKKCDK